MKDTSNYKEIDKILFSENDIKKSVRELGKQINEDYKNSKNQLVLGGILKRACVFLCDLCRELDLNVQIDFMSVSGYGTKTFSIGDVKILKDLDITIKDKDVIIVEDILDTGYTLSYLENNFKSREDNSFKIITLLDKLLRRVVNVKVDYVGFEILDEFVVGYGEDYAEKYRSLPHIACIKSHAK